MASENQASVSKPRSMLPRTLVVVLSPISLVPTTKLHRFSSKKLEKVFDDFKQCNKESISVQLQDAVDDIHFVGWMSPFTLLIHGCTEDMDTIEQAWIGRMLKPPTGFIIKDFGEISEVNMKQISQSQFISICDTLCEIVKGLNESQIAATLECVVSRLCSSFDSVVIPPMAAIKKSLELMVRGRRLDILNGAYYFMYTALNTSQTSGTRAEKLPASASSSYTMKTETQEQNNPHKRRSTSSKKLTEESNCIKRENLNEISSEMEKERLKTKKLENAAKSDTKLRHEEQYLKKKSSSLPLEDMRKSAGKKPKRVVKSSSMKVRKPSQCLPRRQYSYEELNSSLSKTPQSGKKKLNKRHSFLGKISRLFKTESSEDEKLPSNDGSEDGVDIESCHNGWEKVVNDEQMKLLSCNLVREQQTHDASETRKEEKNGMKETKSTRSKKTTVASPTRMNKTRHSENLSKISRNYKRDISRPTPRPKQYYPTRSSCSSTKPLPRSRTPEWVNANLAHNNKKLAEQKTVWRSSNSQTSDQEESLERYSSSSLSESSCSDVNRNHCEYSLSSESSVELPRKSFHYSDDDSTDVEYPEGRRKDAVASNFYSTQAICGDLEMSSLSLNPVNHKITSSNSSSMTVKHIAKLSVIPGVNVNGHLDHDRQQQNIRSRNLVQLIGIL